MHDYDFSMILEGLLLHNRYRDYLVVSSSYDGQNTLNMDVRRPGGEIITVELRFKVL